MNKLGPSETNPLASEIRPATLKRTRSDSESSTSSTEPVNKVATTAIAVQSTQAVPTTQYQIQIQVPIDALDSDLILKIFSFLDHFNVAKTSGVNKLFNKCRNVEIFWNQMDLSTIFPNSMFFLETHWGTNPEYLTAENTQLTLENTEQNDENELEGFRLDDQFTFIPTWQQLCSSLDIEEDAGFSFLTLPKGLNLNNLLKFARDELHFNVEYNPRTLRRTLRNITVEETYQIAISNNLVSGSRGLSIHNQRLMLVNNNIQFPKIIEVVAFWVAMRMNDQSSHFNSQTYTCCREMIGDVNIIVGGNGININYSPALFGIGDTNIGILASILSDNFDNR